MSVYTPVTLEQLAPHLMRLGRTGAHALAGIAAGVVNSNFRLMTDQGPCIVTLVEDPEQGAALPGILAFMEHLAARGIPCPRPLADGTGEAVGWLHGKPLVLVTLLPGTHVMTPGPDHCRAVGAALARLHRAAADHPGLRSNPMGPACWAALGARLQGVVPADQGALIADELAHQRGAWAGAGLPMGGCHLDLFPDNVLFDGTRLSGLIDFHYAGHERLAYDLAVTANAWCFAADGTPDTARFAALGAGYRAVRPLTPEEGAWLPTGLRAAALRFALTRLRDFHFPRPGEHVTRKPPGEFLERLARHRQGELSAPLLG